MFTERTETTPRRTRRRMATGALLAVGSTLTLLGASTPAGALPVGQVGLLAGSVPAAAAPSPTTPELTVGTARPGSLAEARTAAYLAELAQQTDAFLATLPDVEGFLASLAPAPAVDERVAPVLAEAEAKLGRPYVYGASGPNAFDCSGFTRWVWQAAGVELAHYSGAQWAETEHIPVEDLQPGDLVFFWGPGDGDPGHVGLYVGDGQMIHAPGKGRSVRYESIWYWSGARVAAGRVR